MADLIGRKVILHANDFVHKELIATIVKTDVKNKTILLGLDEPFMYENTTYKHVVASPRLSKDGLDVLSNGGALGCSLIWVPEGQFRHTDPFDTSWWRGGAAAIADLSVY